MKDFILIVEWENSRPSNSPHSDSGTQRVLVVAESLRYACRIIAIGKDSKTGISARAIGAVSWGPGENVHYFSAWRKK